jgi:hypothetical protein
LRVETSTTKMRWGSDKGIQTYSKLSPGSKPPGESAAAGQVVRMTSWENVSVCGYKVEKLLVPAK